MKKISLCVTNNLVYDQRMHRICVSLQNAGYQVTLIGRSLGDKNETVPLPFGHVRLHCFFRKKAFFYAEFNIRLFFYLIFSMQDIICANDSDTLPACSLAAWLKKKILVFDAHEYFIEVPELEKRNLVRMIWHILTKVFIRKSKLCYTVSQSLAKELSKVYHKKFEVIRNVPSLDETVSNEYQNQKGQYILYQGAVNKGRGLEMLIDAMEEIDLQLIIAGGGDILDELKRRAEEKKLDQKVIFMGYLMPEEIKPLTKNAFIGYNLLENYSKSYYFSLSNKFFNYMHAGIPSLSNDFPEYRMIIEQLQCGLLVDLEKNAIVNAVKKLQQDETFYQKLRLNSLHAAQEYCWQKEEQNLLKFYSEL